jgi:hypothetical protein
MEDNYLWDRSGEPDPAIQELEAILGTLRYQPRPLEIPHHIQPGRRRTFFPALAIAAAIALFAILLGLWFSFNRRQAPALKATGDKQIVAPQPQDKPNEASQALVQSPTPKVIQKHNEAPRNIMAVYRNRPSRTVIRQPQLTTEELAEKEQVLVALRLVSAKLNLAQRKTQGLPQLNTIRNQHKIG